MPYRQIPDPPMTDPLPEHLLHFIVEQKPENYSWIDHAGWRYIMRRSKAFFKDHAHPKYLDGLAATGISVERLPLISEMDAKMRAFGWRAVAITGFIPPAVFLELQALGVLGIACDMRKVENLGYTPAPDIVHEAAGHAPIIWDKEYRTYLRAYGEAARKAIFSKKDLELYDAILNLSETKEDPHSSSGQIQAAAERLNQAKSAVDYVSEATYLTRMGWWTTEYGMVGKIQNPLIFGAGLLSSVGESFGAFNGEAKRIPFSLDCLNMSFDITRPQPQLYVTPDFATLTEALEELTKTMAYKLGGARGLAKALAAETVNTFEVETGIQVSGVITGFDTDDAGNPVFVRVSGPSQISLNEVQLPGHGPTYHSHGYSSPIGRLKGGKRPQDLTDSDLTLGILEFESGYRIDGKLKSTVRRDGQTLLIQWTECTVTAPDGSVAYQPDWGPFDLICGTRIVSVFGNPADRATYLRETGGYKQKPREQKTNLLPEQKRLNEFYGEIRKIRESRDFGIENKKRTQTIFEESRKLFPNDWLLALEILEVSHLGKWSDPWTSEVRAKLDHQAKTDSSQRELIEQGLALL